MKMYITQKSMDWLCEFSEGYRNNPMFVIIDEEIPKNMDEILAASESVNLIVWGESTTEIVLWGKKEKAREGVTPIEPDQGCTIPKT